MSDKTRRIGAAIGPDEVEGLEGCSKRIRTDLESRGVAPELSLPAARRLSTIAPDLSPKEYSAVIDGVAAATGHPDHAQSVDDITEIQRLMESFSSELRKLEEGLQILSAYVTRMGNRSNRGRPTTFH